MITLTSFRGRALSWQRALLALWLAFATMTALAGNSDYLKAIDEEGDRLEFLGKAKREQEQLEQHVAQASRAAAVSKPVASGPVASGPGASQNDFERQLSRQFPGSYALYALLDPEDRGKVYGEYQKSNLTGAARFFPAVTRIITTSTKNR